MTWKRKFFYLMDTGSPPSTSELPLLANYPEMDDVVQPFIYSFRCSQGMDESLTRIMRERKLNRTAVIRLALYMLDCFSRRSDVRVLPLPEFIRLIEAMEPEEGMDFSDFIRGR